MKVFISWSGHRSGELARELRAFCKRVIHALDPWLSETDLRAGERWGPEIARQLDDANFGLVCVTPESLGSDWLMFEVGALAKSVSNGRVVSILFDLNPANIEPPFSQFQSIELTLEGFKNLFVDLHSEMQEPHINADQVEENVVMFWPAFKEKLI